MVRGTNIKPTLSNTSKTPIEIKIKTETEIKNLKCRKILIQHKSHVTY